MSADNEDDKDFEELMQAIREYGNGGDGLSDDDSRDNHSVPSYEYVYNWNLHESKTNIWAWNPDLSVDEVSWNNAPFANVGTSKNEKSHHTISANSANNDTLESTVLK